MRLEVQDRSEIDRFDIDETLMKSRIHQKLTSSLPAPEDFGDGGFELWEARISKGEAL
jgi:hypothetical protein